MKVKGSRFMINTVSIFLASSSELRRERLLIGNRVRMLNDEWEPRGVHIVLNIWEDYAPEFTGERKQTEYNLNLVDKSDIVFGLFRKLCGKYSQEEVLRAYGNNSDSLYCYRLPAVDDAAVRTFENSSGITIEAVDDIEGVWQKIKYSIENYITSHYTVSDNACTILKEQIYATIGADLRTDEDELGNMIRSVDMLVEQTMGIRCRLLPMMNCRNVGKSDYYIALLNNVLDDQSRDEFVTAYHSKKNNDRPSAIATFQKIDGIVTRYDADNEVSRLMFTSGKEFFPNVYESLDTVKVTLLTYLLRKKQVLSPYAAFAMDENQNLCFGGWRIANTGKALGLKAEMVSEFKVHVDLLELMMPTVPKLGMEASLRREISELLSRDHLDNKEAKKLIEKSSSLITLLRRNVNKGFYKPDYVLRVMLLRIACNDQYSNQIGETPDEYYKEFVDYADRHSMVDIDVETMRINFANAYARGGREDEALILFGVVRSNLRKIDTNAKILRPRLFLLYYNALATLATIRQEVELNEWAEELEAIVEQWIKGDESLTYYRCYPLSFRIDVLSVDVLANESMLTKAEELWKQLINDKVCDDNRFAWLQAIHGLTKSLARYYLDRTSVEGLGKNVVMEYARKSLSYSDVEERLCKELMKYDRDEALDHAAGMLHNRGFLMTKLGMPFEALGYYLKSLECRKQQFEHEPTVRREDAVAETMVNIGALLLETPGRFECSNPTVSMDALYYAETALEIYARHNDGTLYHETNEYKARLLKGTVLYNKGENEELRQEGIDILKDVKQWDEENPDNDYHSTIKNELMKCGIFIINI